MIAHSSQFLLRNNIENSLLTSSSATAFTFFFFSECKFVFANSFVRILLWVQMLLIRASVGIPKRGSWRSSSKYLFVFPISVFSLKGFSLVSRCKRKCVAVLLFVYYKIIKYCHFSVIRRCGACAVTQQGDMHAGWLAPVPAGPCFHRILNALVGFLKKKKVVSY